MQQDAYVQLQQLNGIWKMETARGPLYESWRKTKDNEIRGGSYKMNGKDTIRFEDVRLSKAKEGIYYSPVVKNENGNKPTAFRMISSNDHKFVFENKEHDFPQRIIYHLISKDSLHAWIEGTQNGKNKRTDYYFKRIK
jgi:hypothetical protein